LCAGTKRALDQGVGSEIWSGHAIVDKQSDSGQDWLHDHQSRIGNYGALYAAIFVINSPKETILSERAEIIYRLYEMFSQHRQVTVSLIIFAPLTDFGWFVFYYYKKTYLWLNFWPL
jgi:hypothetical protein